jgi:Zn-finger nucleic acid-binding protein
MQCPLCPQSQLTMSAREGIEIDYCPQCRGVWLDRGELDKIIERTAAVPSEAVTGQPAAAWGQAPAPVQTERYPEQPRYYKARDDDDDNKRYRDDRDGYRHGKKKRGGFLGELFDFD